MNRHPHSSHSSTLRSSVKPRIAVLASGRGSNLRAIVAAIRAGQLAAEVVAVVSDRPNAPALAFAKDQGFPAIAVAAVRGEPRGQHEERILAALASQVQGGMPRFLVMAGYMRIVTPRLIEAFRSERGYSRIVNIHPSILPAFPGAHAYAQAYHHGVALTGVSIHLVEEAVDDGPLLAQRAFSISDCRSVAEVEARGLAVEHELYPQTLNWVLAENFEVEFRNEAPMLAPAPAPVPAPEPASASDPAPQPGSQGGQPAAGAPGCLIRRRLCVRPN